MWTWTGKTKDGRREWQCRNCGGLQLEEQPQGLEIPPKVLYLDIETAFMSVDVFSLYVHTGRLSWKGVEKYKFVICWAAAWVGDEEPQLISDAVTGAQARKRNDKPCLKGIWRLMDEADYIVGHNIRGFDWKTLNYRYIVNGMGAPYKSKITDTLSLSRKYFLPESHALEAWSLRTGGRMKDKMERDDWTKICRHGDEKALAKMEKYCRGDVLEGIKVLRRMQDYIEQMEGKPLFK